uniref:Candidate secreted effector n=1 Tax=Meloidogyne incognita TaxID=6306 RepID=A0A914MKA8_MELIC
MESKIKTILILITLFALIANIYGEGVCVHQGKEYRNGEEWTYRSFIMRCDVHHNYWQTKVVACVSMMGDRIPVGGQKSDRHGLWKCIQDPSGNTRLVQE